MESGESVCDPDAWELGPDGNVRVADCRGCGRKELVTHGQDVTGTRYEGRETVRRVGRWWKCRRCVPAGARGRQVS